MNNKSAGFDKVIVDCSEGYWEFVRQLRNDPRTIRSFVDQVNITEEEQLKYMANNHQYYKICLFRGVPAGYFGVIEDDIRICTHPSYQKKGVASYMLKKLVELHPNPKAKVKIDNLSSNSLFLSSGFSVISRNDEFNFYSLN